MAAKKVPNPIDKHVGSRVRMRRMMLGMSQEKLGDALDLTFQQVQKYEKGTNRIGAHQVILRGHAKVRHWYLRPPSPILLRRCWRHRCSQFPRNGQGQRIRVSGCAGVSMPLPL
jgi:hypothetical protein